MLFILKIAIFELVEYCVKLQHRPQLAKHVVRKHLGLVSIDDMK